MKESVLKRMRWKVRDDKSTKTCISFSFSCKNLAPTILGFKPFEEDGFKLIENIKLRKNQNRFHDSLENDLKKVKEAYETFETF